MIETASSAKLFTRRDVLGGVGALAGAAILSPFDMQAHQPSACELFAGEVDVTSENLVGDIQAKLFADFEIIATTPQVAFQLTQYELVVPGNILAVADDPRVWDSNSLTLLYNVASSLPKHITRSYEGEYVHVALESLPESSCTCGALTYSDLNPDRTHDQDISWLGTYLFETERTVELDHLLMELVTHELAGHRYVLDVMKGKPLLAFAEIFGDDISHAAQRVNAVLSKRPVDSLSPAELKGHGILQGAFSPTNAAGEALSDLREIPAYLSQLYLYGSEAFHNAIEPFLSPRVTDAMYGILRDEIFLGHEYEEFPQMCPS